MKKLQSKWKPKYDEDFWVITATNNELLVEGMREGWLGMSYKDFIWYGKTYKQALSKLKEIKKVLYEK